MWLMLERPSVTLEKRMSPFTVGFWILANGVPVPLTLIQDMAKEVRLKQTIVADRPSLAVAYEISKVDAKKWLPDSVIRASPYSLSEAHRNSHIEMAAALDSETEEANEV